jgi:ADP-ribosylglycohydrolase
MGDCFGGTWFRRRFVPGELKEGPWRWTDDTAMALVLLSVLEDHGEVDQDALAAAFAEATRSAQVTHAHPEAAAGAVNVALAAALNALWCAARHPDDLEAALWDTASGRGDVDTTCAITGGVVGARTGTAGLPASWFAAAEPPDLKP